MDSVTLLEVNITCSTCSFSSSPEHSPISIEFTLNPSKRLIVSDNKNDDSVSEDPGYKSVQILKVSVKDFSWEDIRFVLGQLGLKKSKDKDKVMEEVQTYMDRNVRTMFANSAVKGLKLSLCVMIDEVSVYRNFRRMTAEALMVEEGEQCAICLEDFVDGKEKIIWFPCDHLFHEGCIDRWLKKSIVCPLCRFELPYTKKPRLTVF